jgi:hypothetical protein
MKLAIAECFFGELRGNPNRTGRGRATTPKAAIARAFADVFKQLKGKRITSLRADITVVELRPLEEAPA